MRAVGILIAIALILGAAGVYWWQKQSAPLPAPPASIPAETPLPQAQGPKHPLPEPPPEEKPLPPLKESDATATQALEALIGPKALSSFVRPENLVRHIVVLVDNLPRKTYPTQMNPVQPPKGPFRTTGKGDALSIGTENFARYTPYVRAMDAVDTGKLASTYKRFYPLFQQAYVELGYPNAYFNDRLIEVIDHLLETPEVKPPIKLVVPRVLPEFADPALEDRSSGQKLLIRMGPDNAARVKAKLRALRAEIVTPGTDPLSPKK